jgi:limonene-1,2-epoxide hydrolase
MSYTSRREQLDDLFQGFEGGWGPLEAAFDKHFADDTVWANSGLRTTVGPKDALSLMLESKQLVDLDHVRIEVHKSIEDGDTLLNERTDFIYDSTGKLLFELDIAGVFVFEGEKIVSWREYFDPTPAR